MTFDSFSDCIRQGLQCCDLKSREIRLFSDHVPDLDRRELAVGTDVWSQTEEVFQ